MASLQTADDIKAWLGQGRPDRTFEIVQHSLHGATNTMIARDFGLSEDHVGKILKRFEERLGVLLTGQPGRARPQGK